METSVFDSVAKAKNVVKLRAVIKMHPKPEFLRLTLTCLILSSISAVPGGAVSGSSSLAVEMTSYRFA